MVSRGKVWLFVDPSIRFDLLRGCRSTVMPLALSLEHKRISFSPSHAEAIVELGDLGW